MTFGAWAIVLGILTVFFDDILDKQRNPNADPISQVTSEGAREVVLTRNRAGHYVATGYINNQEVEFLLDTGASDVAVPAHLATNIGLPAGPPVIYRTANGNVRGNLTRINEIRLGDITLNDVRGGINPGMRDNHVLLGMSFLKKLEFTQRGNTLIIRQFPG
jgi:aspartyl protease family protein